MAPQLRRGEYQPDADHRLDEWSKVFQEWPEPPPDDRLHVFVRLPGEDITSALSRIVIVHGPEDVLRRTITIKADARGEFGSVPNLSLNGIHPLDGALPEFLVDFRRKLERKRWLDSNWWKTGFEQEIQFDKYFQDTPTGIDQGNPKSNKRALSHLFFTLNSEGWSSFDDIKEDNIRWTFDELGCHFQSILGLREMHKWWVLQLFYHLVRRLHQL